jgi:NAD(P)-dependent dehydrogenase (short-subunit alcohol dehydrogenase family)
MARVLITGSADGLGRAAAETLIGDGHEVLIHARTAERLAAVERCSAEARQPSLVTCRTSPRRGRWPIRSTCWAG